MRRIFLTSRGINHGNERHLGLRNKHNIKTKCIGPQQLSSPTYSIWLKGLIWPAIVEKLPSKQTIVKGFDSFVLPWSHTLMLSRTPSSWSKWAELLLGSGQPTCSLPISSSAFSLYCSNRSRTCQPQRSRHTCETGLPNIPPELSGIFVFPMRKNACCHWMVMTCIHELALNWSRPVLIS